MAITIISQELQAEPRTPDRLRAAGGRAAGRREGSFLVLGREWGAILGDYYGSF